MLSADDILPMILYIFPAFLQHNARGILSMANSGPNTNGSQFFIAYAKQPHLNGLYTVFGRVIHGFEVLDLMEKVRCDGIITISLKELCCDPISCATCLLDAACNTSTSMKFHT